MNAASAALLIGAVSTGIAVVVSAFMPLLLKRVKEVKAEVKDVHNLVNSHRAQLVKRVAQLETALLEGGLSIPEPTREDT